MGKHIMIIDDEPHFRYAASLALKKAGFSTSEADSGEKAIEMILRMIRSGEAPDLLLLDIHLPGISGDELFDFLRKNSIDYPVIAISGYGRKFQVEEIMVRGCDDYLDKPFEPDELVARIETILSRRQQGMNH